MKKLFFLTLFGLTLLILGCSTNSNNNPVTTDAFSKTETSTGLNEQGIIELNEKLPIPNQPGNYFKLEGMLNYTEELSKENVPTSALGYEARVNISVNATLTSKNPSTGNVETRKISSEKEEQISIPANGTKIFEKSFPIIPGGPKGTNIICTFEISAHGLQLRNIELVSAYV